MSTADKKRLYTTRTALARTLRVIREFWHRRWAAGVLEFASRERVDAHPELVEDFVRRVLNLDWAWISDESSLWDFHSSGDNGALVAKINEVYGIDVSDIESAKIWQILDRIAASRVA